MAVATRPPLRFTWISIIFMLCAVHTVLSQEFGDITITEIMVNPSSVPDNDGEWFEVFNTTLDTFDLNGMTISDNSSSFVINNGGPLWLCGRCYFIFGVNQDTGTNGGVMVDYVYSGLPLNNSGDVLSISTTDIIELVDFSSWNIPSGATLSLDPRLYFEDPNPPLTQEDVWCAADTLYNGTDFGTPGERNGCCEIDFDDDEIPDPDLDGDGFLCDEDCDDTKFWIYPGAIEFCDGFDGDCDGVIPLTEIDNDNDGFSECEGDCDDADPSIYPGAMLCGGIVITEIMANPSLVDDTVGEWFEIVNATDDTIDLSGLVISNSTSSDTIDGGPVLLCGGCFFILGNNADTAQNGGVMVDFVYELSTLNDTGDVLVVSTSTVLDAVPFVDFPFDPPVGAALSLHMSTYTSFGGKGQFYNDDPALWCVADTLYNASDYGTPGANNGCCGAMDVDLDGDSCDVDCNDYDPLIFPGASEGCNGVDSDCDGVPSPNEIDNDGDGYAECEGDIHDDHPGIYPGVIPAGALIITEMMINPSLPVDSLGEWIEIYNPGTMTYDLDRALLSDNTGTIMLDHGGPLPICGGCFLVVGSNGDTATNGGVNIDHDYDAFFLNNTGDQVVLVSPDGSTFLDGVDFNGWSTPNDSALALSASYYSLDNDEEMYWCAATAEYGDGHHGTPGMDNGCCDGAQDVDSDGFPCSDDCNDGLPWIFPGAPDAPCNGIDENCDGADSVDVANDMDEDGHCENTDNCPDDYNPIQSDIDGDGIGDLCDPDFIAPDRVGIGVDTPRAKLHIQDGRIFIDNDSGMMILRSSDGQCWMLTVSTTGELETSLVDCPK